jgi:ubiquinone/menaquinone biosynthesis C-methylase UbiE
MNSDLLKIVDYNRLQTGSESDGFTEERYSQMANMLPTEALSILDVGCGIGRGGAVLKQLRPELTIIGIDCVPERTARLDRTIYSEVHTGFTMDLPMEDRSVDTIIAGEFLQHVPPKHIALTLCEFFRVLALHGVLCMTTPNPYYIKNKIKKLSVLMDPSHVTQHYPKILRYRLMEVGFSNISIRGSGRVSKILGSRFPNFLYGSYMITATKW